MRSFVGTDPGKGGGAAWIMPDDFGSVLVETVAFSKLTQRDLLEWYIERADESTLGIVEQVHAMPGQGVTSMFTFGRMYERVLMAHIVAGISFEKVTPRKWQGALGIRFPRGSTGPQRKRILKGRAQELFPEIKVTLAISDALLIAHYGRGLNL